MPELLLKAARKDLIAALWPAGSASSMKTWMILDCARDERIHRVVDRSYQEKTCLFAGTLPLQLTSVAPHLLQLAIDDPMTEFLLDHGWGNAWGIFLKSTASLETLRRHFRSFLRVRDHSKRRLLFRYYDPRVLRIFLPTCLPDQLSQVFEGVDRFLVEGEEQNQMLDYRFVGRKLETASIGLGVSPNR